MKTGIFIVDDHPIVRQGLAQLINQEADLCVAGQAENATEALREIARIKPRLALVDISLNGTSGIELTKDILQQQPEIKILIISMYDESIYFERAMHAGARGYLTKQEAASRVVIAIRKALSGEIYVSEKWRVKWMNQFAFRRPVPSECVPKTLSDRELEVLRLVGQAYATTKIAETLHVSRKTIESHFANIKNKLDLKNSNELIQHAVKYCLAENVI